MSRPLYETSTDLYREREVADAVERAWGFKLHKLPATYRVDFVGVRGNQVDAWIEVKCRNHPSDQYPTLMLSVSKWQAGIYLHQTTGAPFFVVAKFSCGAIRYVEAITIDVEFVYGGRTAQTRDSADIEPVVMIPVKAMKEL